MKNNPKGSCCIQVLKVNGKKEYSYMAEVILTPEDAKMALPVDEEQDIVKILINKKSFYLAVLRTFPQAEGEVKKIIAFSNGERINLSIFERLMLWRKKL